MRSTDSAARIKPSRSNENPVEPKIKLEKNNKHGYKFKMRGSHHSMLALVP